jgi:hypothetical protein
MGVNLHAVTLDSRDPAVLAEFWARALGGVVRDSGNGYLAVEEVSGLSGRLLIQPVDDERPGRTRSIWT